MTKETLILIPGSACDATVWQQQIKVLSTTFKIIVPELSNCQSFNAMVQHCLDQAPPHFLLAGHSLGGCIAMEIVKQAPERVMKLCLFATSPFKDDKTYTRQRIERIALAESDDYPRLAYTLATQFTYEKKMVLKVFEMFLKNQKLFVQQQRNIMQWKGTESFLSTFYQPTLLLVGKQDAFFYDTTQTIAKKIPNNMFKIIDNCGHMLTMERPEQISNIMKNWL